MGQARVHNKVKILNYLAGANKSLTVAEAKNKLRIGNVYARVNELRKEGFAIYTNRKIAKNGKTVFCYKLGTPSKNFSKFFNAGKLEAACRVLYVGALRKAA